MKSGGGPGGEGGTFKFGGGPGGGGAALLILGGGPGGGGTPLLKSNGGGPEGGGGGGRGTFIESSEPREDEELREMDELCVVARLLGAGEEGMLQLCGERVDHVSGKARHTHTLQ